MIEGFVINLVVVAVVVGVLWLGSLGITACMRSSQISREEERRWRNGL